jgi:hypothetical protein
MIRHGVGRLWISTVVGFLLCVMLGVTFGSGVALASESQPKPFEITEFSMQTLEFGEMAEEGVPDVFRQAGGHPWALAIKIRFATETLLLQNGSKPESFEVPTRDIKDLVLGLPDGLTLNPNPIQFPRCSLLRLFSGTPCPADTQVGVVKVHYLGATSFNPLYSVTPEKGQSAEFGLEAGFGIHTVATGHVVRKGDSYGLVGIDSGIPEAEITEIEPIFWGVPADPSHDARRGAPSRALPAAFVTMPANCSLSGVAATVSADSWEEPGRFVSAPPAVLPSMTGCDRLGFNPGIETLPDTPLADAPVGLGVNVLVPQIESPTAPVTPQLRNSVVTLPQGVSISPAIVDGIEACEESGPQGINFEGPLSEEIGVSGESQLAPGRCPNASIIGTAKAFSPLLAAPVEGHVYLAKPHCGGGQRPCTEQDAADGELYQIYLELGGTGELANTGVNLKVRGKVEADPATGQLTTVFENTPQLPFSKLEVDLNGGPRSALDNPPACGLARTTTDFTPWSAPITVEGVTIAGTPDGTPSSTYEVVGCESPSPFKPSMLAGTVTPMAGQYSAFTVSLARKDREQYFRGIQLRTPPGLLGVLANVPLCGASDAESGACPLASKIGTARVASGAGSHPFEIEGSVYLTGPYEGAPFGLSVVTHAVAGPFDLGLVVVRLRVQIDPKSSTLIVSTDESGPHAIPQVLFGVPLRLQRISVNIDRSKFMFNPTNCRPQRITADISGSQQARASIDRPFAVAGCKRLVFKPSFSASTSARTSRSKGASLDVKLAYPSGSLGKAANVARVKVSLPKQLPSRLTTLQKACPAAVFDRNPAECPPAAVVGIVRAHTPLLALELMGPVYFVSHGGEAFPSLIIVLEGEGVRVDLTGTTFINKAGITSSTFKTLPDVPVGSFELYLPQGKYSALAANGNLCKAQSKLRMPTEMVAQNGLVLHRNTLISVTGCSKRRGPTPRRATVRSRHANSRASKASR